MLSVCFINKNHQKHASLWRRKLSLSNNWRWRHNHNGTEQDSLLEQEMFEQIWRHNHNGTEQDSLLEQEMFEQIFHLEKEWRLYYMYRVYMHSSLDSRSFPVIRQAGRDTLLCARLLVVDHHYFYVFWSWMLPFVVHCVLYTKETYKNNKKGFRDWSLQQKARKQELWICIFSQGRD